MRRLLYCVAHTLTGRYVAARIFYGGELMICIYRELQSKNSFEKVCDISQNDAVILLNLENAFVLLHSKATLWWSMYKDYMELIDYLNCISKSAADHKAISLIHDPIVLSSICRHVNSFLSSSSIMLTILEQDFPTAGDKEKWNEKRRSLHRDNIEYRFCYELRNYSQHYHLPINSLGVAYNTNSSPYMTIGFFLQNKDNKVCKKLDSILHDVGNVVNVALYFEKYFKILSCLFFDYMKFSEKLMLNCDGHLISILTKYGLGQVKDFMVCNQPNNGTYEDIIKKSTYINLQSYYWTKKQIEVAKQVTAT
ncbi:hypothetical protein KY897_004285 [Vibrio vulnificus]|nr:hypothetical protein [Vibrio vulnificus]